ncbi:Haloacid dehalogenase domain protein hydrolase [Halothermothrix orenii H 168]|uniref:Haloacid dehalogenase domain protein hydrolase n=1 Tax=Halothermothrix orenii (strain H 168 / OCM 544 / DSM 9562) TaxID=373903 RepID=B8CZ35_HALOH|nr:Haloacid dehalogenase domain protein hydrolase [Halothermothrix orenii H 168]
MTREFLDLASPEEFIKILMKSTEDMINNDGQKVNRVVFEESFFKLLEVNNPEEIMARFDKFYRERFPYLGEGLEVDNTSCKIIEMLKKKGYGLVLATNPVFPPEAIRERLSWSGLKADDFDFITHYNNMHYCKPNLKYYKEILKNIGATPSRCYMVGNDVEEDMVAGRLGIKTYLIKDNLIERGNSTIPEPDWQGSLAGLFEYLKLNS